VKKLHYILIVCCFLLSFSSNAQEEVSIVTKDTLRAFINPNAPAKAAFYSAILPGLGQAYNKKYWKIPLVYAGLGAGVYYYTWNQKKYHEFRDEYKRRLDGTSDPNHPIYGDVDNDRLIRAQQFHQRNRDLSALITAGIYILNIIDANVDAHLLQFNVNENLSISPDIHHNPIENKFNTGLRLSYEF
jgi:hypothetical protein